MVVWPLPASLTGPRDERGERVGAGIGQGVQFAGFRGAFGADARPAQVGAAHPDEDRAEPRVRVSAAELSDALDGAGKGAQGEVVRGGGVFAEPEREGAEPCAVFREQAPRPGFGVLPDLAYEVHRPLDAASGEKD